MENQEEINTSENKPQKSWRTIFLIILVFVLFGSNFFTAYILYNKNAKINVELSVENNVKEQDLFETKIINEAVLEDESKEEKKIESIKDLETGEIEIDWYKTIATTSYEELFSKEDMDNYLEMFKNIGFMPGQDESVNRFNFYKIGKVSTGPYQNKELFIITFRPEGPAHRDTMFRVINNDKELIYLENYSDRLWGVYENMFLSNKGIVIKNLEAPDAINIPNSDIKLLKSATDPMILFEDLNNYTELYSDNEEGSVYGNTDTGCFAVKASDSTVRYYYFDLDFVAPREDNSVYKGSIPNVLQIIWEDETRNEDEYVSHTFSCGGVRCFSYPEYFDDIESLREVGKTINGDLIYELEDRATKDELDKISVLKSMYDSTYFSKEKSEDDYNEFLDDHPIIFWQDPFGNFIEFKKAKYQPMAECGKPVIYLYPETEIDVLVQVYPSGGLTITDPLYNKGWKVKASPDGELYNYDDDSIYPYLFWEGLGLDYRRPEKGFVVEKEKVQIFLEEKLNKLGLIKKEYDEFIEFWLPRMQSDKFYFITFVPKEEFDKLAPLFVFPTPDTVIRIFMDFEGLDEYEEVEEQIISTPERNGFTVVEWGGALHK